MNIKNFRFETDSDGIALITWDMPERSMNVITMDVMDELETLIDKIVADDSLIGAVITSGKDTFSGGADLTMLQGLLNSFQQGIKEKDQQAITREIYEGVSRLTQTYRKLETCGKAFVCAINGLCVGGAFELALSCHARIAADNTKTRVGLPEIKVGLFPGAGGTQRVMRMCDPQAGLQMLLQGRLIDLKRAKAMQLIDDIVPEDQLIVLAKARIKEGLSAEKPWDKKGFKLPGGKIYSPAGFQFWPAANAIYRRETFDNYPAARALLQAVYEGLQLPMDQALRIEAQYFTDILRSPECASMVRSLFVSMQDLNKGARRPAHVESRPLQKIGIIGAGFMGAGIALVTAKAGMDVILLDRDREAAEKGKASSEDYMAKRIAKGRATAEEKEALLAKIKPSSDYSSLSDCDLVIEAVFEDREIKRTVTEATEAVIGTDIPFASNTSTLPITSLAEVSKRPENFIGIHFFSPVDKMMLVEIIMGEKTGDTALAIALDYVRAIKKTPIVVNDSRGFYANRCVVNYLREAHIMLMEGVPPAMVENIARMAGMPIGPLALSDEVALDLAWRILQATKADLGEDAVDTRQEQLLKIMVVDHERFGRKNGKGFYDYHGKNKNLWPDLIDVIGAPKRSADDFDVQELKHRFLTVQAVEAARCVEEHVITDIREADVGSILGFGFAPYSGGTLSYIDNMGSKTFVDLLKQLQEKHGGRFKPNDLLLDMAAKGEGFYDRFANDSATGTAMQ